MLTPNKVPKKWAEYHKKVLMEEAGDAKFITISREPLDWGINLIQTEYGITNIYKQVLRGAKIATTPYIAIADDDTLYPREHFLFRPPLDKFAYNHTRWHIFSWKTKVPYYFYKGRPGNGLMIASREIVIKAIENRLLHYPDGFTGFLTQELGVKTYTRRYDVCDYVPFYTYHPVVSFFHTGSFDKLNQQRRKVPGPVQCFDLPKWGRADEVIKKFNGPYE
jgi:hypothetical protein